MHRYWETLIEPLCELLEPRTIVEVGAAAGLGTRKVLAYCRRAGARLEVIDPAPIDLAATDAELARDLSELADVHQATSHEVLGDVCGDLFLVDGDHNWFTVHGELERIRDCALATGRPLPAVVLHDTGWPYGRRDMYYAPERLPEEARRPSARRGLWPGFAGTLAEGGLNGKHWNALEEGGPRNGVLTGIEDFLAESGSAWRRYEFPSFHGLVVLVDPATVPEERRAAVVELLTLSEAARRQLERVEEERLVLRAELAQTYERLGGPPGKRLSALVRRLRGLLRLVGKG